MFSFFLKKLNKYIYIRMITELVFFRLKAAWVEIVVHIVRTSNM